MDFFNKAYGQVSDLVQSMTPAARLTTGLLVAAIGISLAFLFRQQTESADELLFGGQILTSNEIANMSAALSTEDLNGWETEGNRLRVPRGQRHKYIAALVKHHALPQDADSASERMLGEQSPWDNRKMGELRARHALEKDLSFTIREFHGIDAAVVKIQEIMDDGFPARPKRRAAVTVKASGTAALDATQIRMIRDVVAFGGGVDQSDVVIADTNGHRSYTGPPKNDEISGDQNAYAETQRFWEQEFKRKIVDKLSVYPNTNVEVYVELDPTLEDRTTQLKYDEKPTPLKTRTASMDEKSVTSPNAGRPGVESNIASNRAIAVGNHPGTENTITESVEEAENAAGVTQQITRKTGLAPKLVTASIGVPKSYFKEVWRQQNPTREDEEPEEPTPTELQAIEKQVIAEIQDAVVQLIPKAPAGEDTFPRVKVTPYTDLPTQEPPMPSLADTAGAWFASNWQTLAMLGVALFGVIFLRGMIHSAQHSAIAATGSSTEDARNLADSQPSGGADVDEDEDGDNFGNSLRSRFQSSGRSLRDELTELVRDDPDGAASVLQNWITEADAAGRRQSVNV